VIWFYDQIWHTKYIALQLHTILWLSHAEDLEEHVKMKQIGGLGGGFIAFHCVGKVMDVFHPKSKYNNGPIAKLANVFVNVEERRRRERESLALMQVTSWTQEPMQWWPK